MKRKEKDMARLYDMHMHTRFSGDSDANPLDMIASAKDAGLAGLIFTDHLDWDYWNAPNMFDLDLKHYLPTLRQIASESSTSDFSIGVGVELGLQEHLADKHQLLLNEENFDFVIGSIHQVHKKDPYYDSFYEGREPYDAFKEYLECTLDNLNAFHNIDTLGHMDYVVRYAKRFYGPEVALHVADFKDIIEAIFQLLIKNDICLEINTGGYRHGLPEPNPSVELLQFYRELGGHLLTLGADAHKPEHVALEFQRIPTLLKDLGFTSMVHFTNRRGTEIEL